MNQPKTRLKALALFLTLASVAACEEFAEPLLRNLPPGVSVVSSTEVPPAQTQAIGQKLGGKIERLTNSVVRVHGRSIQVNAITAVDEPNARAIHAALSKSKSQPYCLRKGKVVIEYVGREIDVAIATKTSYELGLQPRPDRVRYRVVAELATVESADYMACNPLFNQLLALQSGKNPTAIQQITELSKKFQFGRTLFLRNPKLVDSEKYEFQPATINSQERESRVAYSFGKVPEREGVPYVTVTIEMTVNGTGFRESTAVPAKELTSATRFWPADQPGIVTLARKITAGKTTNDAKTAAILEWLSPGQNLKYSGQTGSRWGTNKVFEQKYGHCWDFSDAFVTLARAAGVPSRQLAGWFYGSSGHVWAEYFREGQGWQQVDPTGGGKLRCGIYHLAYFATDDGEMPILYVALPRIETVPTQ